MSSIQIQRLTKRFGSTIAVDAVDLSVGDGDLFFLLGPSGCGKTTLLRMIAGFIDPTSGRIGFGERDVTTIPPNRRNTGMVFQSYALWPHMTVRENVAYGLTVRKVRPEEKSERVRRALEIVRMDEYAKRKPNQLSGGQQQRVALARALVIKPAVLLLDEPLSNLDAKLRLEMRSEIRRICKETGITTVYVTHDQTEALSMADQVAVMRTGRVMQVGPPRDLYERPASRFVADFLGETNFLPGRVTARDGDGVRLETPAGTLVSASTPGALVDGMAVTCSVRPEAIRPADDRADGTNVIEGRLLDSTYLGGQMQHVVELTDSLRIRVTQLGARTIDDASDHVRLTIDPRDVVVLADAEPAPT